MLALPVRSLAVKTSGKFPNHSEPQFSCKEITHLP